MGERGEQGGEPFPAGVIHTCEWFVEQEGIGALGNSAGNENPFALPSGKLADLACAQGEVGYVQRGFNGFAIRGSVAA